MTTKELAAVLDEVARREAKVRHVLIAIRDYNRTEVVKDAFAYDRLREAYRKAARQGLAYLDEGGSGSELLTGGENGPE